MGWNLSTSSFRLDISSQFKPTLSSFKLCLLEDWCSLRQLRERELSEVAKSLHRCSDRYCRVNMPALQPSRVSSEAPEVVPGQFLTTATDSTNIPPPSPSASPSRPSSYLASQHSRAHSWLSTISDRKSKQPDGTRIPQIIHDDAEPYQPKVHSRRVFSLMTTVILVLVAFFLGGGVGGGVASAAMSAQKSRWVLGWRASISNEMLIK